MTGTPEEVLFLGGVLAAVQMCVNLAAKPHVFKAASAKPQRLLPVDSVVAQAAYFVPKKALPSYLRAFRYPFTLLAESYGKVTSR